MEPTTAASAATTTHSDEAEATVPCPGCKKHVRIAKTTGLTDARHKCGTEQERAQRESAEGPRAKRTTTPPPPPMIPMTAPQTNAIAAQADNILTVLTAAAPTGAPPTTTTPAAQPNPSTQQPTPQAAPLPLLAPMNPITTSLNIGNADVEDIWDLNTKRYGALNWISCLYNTRTLNCPDAACVTLGPFTTPQELATHVREQHHATEEQVIDVLAVHRRTICAPEGSGLVCVRAAHMGLLALTDGYGAAQGHEGCPSQAIYQLTRERKKLMRDMASNIGHKLIIEEEWRTSTKPEQRMKYHLKKLINATASGAEDAMEMHADDLTAPNDDINDPDRHKYDPSVDSESSRVIRALERAADLLQQNKPGKAMQALKPSKHFKLDKDNYGQVLTDLFPPAPPDGEENLHPDPAAPFQPLLKPSTLEGILRERVARANGPTGTTHSYAVMLEVCANGDHWREAMTIFMQLVADGRFNRCHTGARMRTGRLCLIAKPNGKARPISVPEPTINAPHVDLARHVNEALASHYPDDISYGTPDGALKVYDKLSRLAAQAAENKEPFVIIATDMSNAYSALSLDKAKEVIKNFPDEEIAERVKLLERVLNVRHEGALSSFHLDDGEHKTYRKTRGVDMGGPCSAAIFTLTMQPAINKARSENPDVYLGTCMDDHTYGGDPREVAKSAATVMPHVRECGVAYNVDKTQIYTPGPLTDAAWADLEALGFKREHATAEGIIVLGIPLGTDEFVKQHVKEKVDGAIAIVDGILRAVLSIPPDKRPRAILSATFDALRLCIAARVTHFERALNPALIAPCLLPLTQRIENAVGELMLDIAPPTETEKATMVDRMHLLTKYGGLGLVDHRISAPVQRVMAVLKQTAEEVSTLNNAGDRVAAWMRHNGFGEALGLLKEEANRSDNGNAEPNDEMEKWLQELAAGKLTYAKAGAEVKSILAKRRFDQHITRLSPPLQARAQSERAPGAATTFTLPQPTGRRRRKHQALELLGQTRMSDSDFRMSITMRVLAPMMPSREDGQPLECPHDACKGTVDRAGLHAECCPMFKAMRTKAHTKLQDSVEKFTRHHLGADVQKGPEYDNVFSASSELHLPRKKAAGTHKHADLKITVDDKQPLTIDFCIAAVKPTNAASALTTPGALGKPLEDAKWTDLNALYHVQEKHKSAIFMCAWETTGGHTARTESCIDNHLFQQRAAKLQNKHLVPNPSAVNMSHLAAKFKANTARVVRAGACSMRRTYREKLLAKAGASNAAPMQKMVRLRID